MAQQTAVDFLYEFVQMKLTNEQQMQFEGLFQQAKQMEKDQLIQTYNDGYKDGQTDTDRSKDISEFSNAKLYYNETFKKQ